MPVPARRGRGIFDLARAARTPPGARCRPRRADDDAREAAATRDKGRKLIASNRKARHDYEILKTYEAGLVLRGTEVKSLRAGQASLVDAFAQERDGELWLYGLHIAEYGYGTWTNHQPRRMRKLLLRRAEIVKILDRIRDPGLTLVPLSMYFENGWAKVEIGVARGKRAYDKRQALAERDANREIARELGRHLKGRTAATR
ncbi:SsrA-binding protein SmpB [Micromonospora sp. NPDC049559]|uniref:SsrA-binding protein SmpB n=1 Tax=Micromonospora sp. NPDC049559 TaxID=3155923 RepID=UPI00341D89CC